MKSTLHIRPTVTLLARIACLVFAAFALPLAGYGATTRTAPAVLPAAQKELILMLMGTPVTDHGQKRIIERNVFVYLDPNGSIKYKGKRYTQVVGVNGTWTWTVFGARGDPLQSCTAQLQTTDGALTGKLLTVDPAGEMTEQVVLDGKSPNDELSFTVTRTNSTSKYTGKVTGDEIEGTIENEHDEQKATARWRARRASDRAYAAAQQKAKRLQATRVAELREAEARRAFEQPTNVNGVILQRLFGGLPDKSASAVTAGGSDGCHLAYAAQRGDKWFVVRDGREGRGHDLIGGRMQFSPDGKRLAYIAADIILTELIRYHDLVGSSEKFESKSAPPWRVIVDGARFGPYEDINLDSLAFGPDSQKIAYIASEKAFSLPRLNKRIAVDWRVFTNGKPEPDCGRPFPPLVFSPDGTRLAYMIKRGPKCCVVADGQPGAEYADVGAPVFSRDGKRIAYPAKKASNRRCFVIDGKEGAEYESVYDFSFSPDGAHCAYVAKSNDVCRVVLDGHEGPPYTPIVELAFTGDGKRTAYRASKDARGTKEIVVADAEEGPQYDQVGGIVCSGDGRSVAYDAKVGNAWFVVKDGAKGPDFDQTAWITFSADGGHFAYCARQGNRWMAIIDGKEQAKFDKVGEVRFGQNGRFFYQAEDSNKCFVVVAHKRGPDFDAIFKPGPQLRSDGAVEYLASGTDKKSLYRAVHLP